MKIDLKIGIITAAIVMATLLPQSAKAINQVINHNKKEVASVIRVKTEKKKIHKYGITRLRSGYFDEIVGYDEFDCTIHDVYNPKEDYSPTEHNPQTTWHYVTCPSEISR